MGLFNKIFGQKSLDKELIGVWNSDLTDQITKKTLGEVTMTFTDDGKLTYDIHENEKIQRINMVYSLIGDTIITDQPSNPRQEKTKYRIEDGKILVMEFGGEITKFTKK